LVVDVVRSAVRFGERDPGGIRGDGMEPPPRHLLH
jgi:hypothetical protein